MAIIARILHIYNLPSTLHMPSECKNYKDLSIFFTKIFSCTEQNHEQVDKEKLPN